MMMVEYDISVSYCINQEKDHTTPMRKYKKRKYCQMEAEWQLNRV